MDIMVHTVATQTEALHMARFVNVAVTTPKMDIPRKGDFWGVQDESGEFTDTGTVKAKPVGSLVSVIYDRTGQKGMLSVSRFNRIGSREWIVR